MDILAAFRLAYVRKTQCFSFSASQLCLPLCGDITSDMRGLNLQGKIWLA